MIEHIKRETDGLKQYEDKIKSLIDIENPTRELIQIIIENSYRKR